MATIGVDAVEATLSHGPYQVMENILGDVQPLLLQDQYEAGKVSVWWKVFSCVSP